VCFYIECADQAALEEVLRQARCAFIDATDFDLYTCNRGGLAYPTLESIEVDLECK
jgi:hypothetical protein